MAIVVIPKTEAECNQLISVLHSHNRKLFCTHKVDATITVGKAVICWGGDDTDYAVRPVDAAVLDEFPVENVPVNVLYNRLYRM